MTCLASLTGCGPDSVRPELRRIFLPRALLNNLHSGAQCSAYRKGSSRRPVSSAFPSSEKKSLPRSKSNGGWTSTWPICVTACESGAWGPENLSPNFGSPHDLRGHPLICLVECLRWFQMHSKEQRTAPHCEGHGYRCSERKPLSHHQH